MRSLRDIAEHFPNSRKAGLTDAEVAESRGEVRREPAHAAAARAALEEVPREVRRADHQDPARGGAALDGRRSVRGLDALAGGARRSRRSLAVFVAALVAKIGDWVPSILFALAAVLVDRRPRDRRTPRTRAWRS